MPGLVLIVDDVASNVKLLEAKLTAEYFEVLTASNGMEALAKIKSDQPDIILLDVMMPGMDGFEVCRRIKKDPSTAHIPVVITTALDQSSDRVTGFNAGADDFLSKPIDDATLFARVQNLVRLKRMTDELRMREATGSSMGLLEPAETLSEAFPTGRILLIEDRPETVKWFEAALCPQNHLVALDSFEDALTRVRSGDFDLIIVSLGLRGYDGLRLCSQLRSLPGGRNVPILVVVSEGDRRKLHQALEMGVNDYLTRPIDRNELIARVGNLIRKQFYHGRLRQRAARTDSDSSSLSTASAAHRPPLDYLDQDPLGATAIVSGDRIALTLTTKDKTQYQDNDVEQFRIEALRKISLLADVAVRVSNAPGWGELSRTVELLHKEACRPTEEYGEHSLTWWSLSVSLASFLEQSKSPRAGPHNIVDSLEPDIERTLSDLVTTVAPFVRSFETPRTLDSELQEFRAPTESIDAARRVAASAGRKSVIDAKDAALLATVLEHSVDEGVQSRKVLGFGVKSVLNIIGAAVVLILGGGIKKIVEKAVEKAADKSVLVDRVADLLISAESDIVSLYEAAAPDVREVARQLIGKHKAQLQQNRLLPLNQRKDRSSPIWREST